jgi:UDP-N-acetylmuramoyl-L-alanyl-D-glutamate--2,6-diaminopimelate ligase
MVDDRAARFAAARSRLTTAAVTGTNGKTTTTTMIAAVVRAAGEPASWLTTLGAWVDDDRIEGDDPGDEFLRLAEAATARGVRTVALEFTSKALRGGLARRWPPDVAVFTNLSRDHMDMHASPEEYLAAKAQLFMALPAGGQGVLNADDPATELIAATMKPQVARKTYSVRDRSADLAATAVDSAPTGTRVTLAPSPLADALGGTLELAVVGDVHAQNALGAALACDFLGYPADAIRRGLEQFTGVAGRFEIVGRDPLVAVDYAHTPDGLRGTLQTARRLVGAAGRLICLFGCGGDRDRGKRPEMGATVHRLADLAVLTSDNPRTEDPAAIARAVRAGATGTGADWIEELDRPAAIARAIATAGAADVVVIAGKGHETYQEIGRDKIPMSDAALARDAIERRRRT